MAKGAEDNIISIMGPTDHFLPLFSQHYYNSAFENDSSDWVRSQTEHKYLGKNKSKKWSESDHCFQFFKQKLIIK